MLLAPCRLTSRRPHPTRKATFSGSAAAGSRRPFSVTQLRIWNGSSCPLTAGWRAVIRSPGIGRPRCARSCRSLVCERTAGVGPPRPRPLVHCERRYSADPRSVRTSIVRIGPTQYNHVIVSTWIYRVFPLMKRWGARHLSWAAPQAHRHLSQRVCLPIQSTLLPARLVRTHARARLAPSPDELLGYHRARQSPQRRADSPAPAAAPQDSDRHAGRPINTSRKNRTQPRFGLHPPALDIDQPGTTG